MDARRISGIEISRKKLKQQASNTTGGRWRQQAKIKLDGEMWSVDYVPQGSSQVT